MARYNKEDIDPDLKRVMAQFCNIIIPGHDKKPGYINVREKVKLTGKDRRTYYHWKNCESFPPLKTFLSLLNKNK